MVQTGRAQLGLLMWGLPWWVRGVVWCVWWGQEEGEKTGAASEKWWGSDAWVWFCLAQKSPTCMGVPHAEIQEPSAGFFGLIDVLAFA